MVTVRYATQLLHAESCTPTGICCSAAASVPAGLQFICARSPVLGLWSLSPAGSPVPPQFRLLDIDMWRKHCNCEQSRKRHRTQLCQDRASTASSIAPNFLLIDIAQSSTLIEAEGPRSLSFSTTVFTIWLLFKYSNTFAPGREVRNGYVRQ